LLKKVSTGYQMLHLTYFSICDKNPIMDDSDDFYREPKRQCIQPFGQNHDYETATTSSYIPSSWGAQNGVFDGLENISHQPNLDTDLSGYFEPYCAAELPSWSNLPDFDPGYPTRETLSEDIPIQSSELETHAPGFGISMEGFTDGRPFNIVTQTDSELNIGWLLDGVSQEAVAVVEEPNAKIITKDYVHKASKLSNHCDTYASIPLQFPGDSPLNLEGDKISQNRREPISHASGISASESVGTVVHSEQNYSGQSIGVLWLSRSIGPKGSD
jgi:hypothetical protein